MARLTRHGADHSSGCMALQVLLLSLLFTGYLVNIAAVTPVLQWVHYLSVFFFGFESLIVNEMSGINLIFTVSSPPPSAILQKTLVLHMWHTTLLRPCLPVCSKLLCASICELADCWAIPCSLCGHVPLLI